MGFIQCTRCFKPRVAKKERIGPGRQCKWVKRVGGGELERALKAEPLGSKLPLVSWKNRGLLWLDFLIFFFKK